MISALTVFKIIGTFIGKYWRMIVVLLLIGAYTGFIYGQGYKKAYNLQEVKYEKRISDGLAGLTKKVESIELIANSNSLKAQASQRELVADLAKISRDWKNKKLYTINNQGQCEPSEDFFNSYRSVILRGNE